MIPTKEQTAMARAPRKAAAAPAAEPEATQTEETTSSKRGPGELAKTHLAWIDANYGQVDRLELLYLAQTTRRDFRESAEYEAYLEAEDERKEKAEQEKADRAKAKAANDKAAEAAAVADTATPTRSRRGRAAAAPVAEEAPVVEAAKPARRSRATKAAAPAAAAEATEAPATPAKGRRRTPAPF